MGINTLDRLVRDLGAAAGADKPPIITAIDRRTVWAWLPIGRRVPAPDPEFLAAAVPLDGGARETEEHTSELQTLRRISYAVFCLLNNIKYTCHSHLTRTYTHKSQTHQLPNSRAYDH